MAQLTHRSHQPAPRPPNLLRTRTRTCSRLPDYRTVRERHGQERILSPPARHLRETTGRIRPAWSVQRSATLRPEMCTASDSAAQAAQLPSPPGNSSVADIELVAQTSSGALVNKQSSGL